MYGQWQSLSQLAMAKRGTMPNEKSRCSSSNDRYTHTPYIKTKQETAKQKLRRTAIVLQKETRTMACIMWSFIIRRSSSTSFPTLTFDTTRSERDTFVDVRRKIKEWTTTAERQKRKREMESHVVEVFPLLAVVTTVITPSHRIIQIHTLWCTLSKFFLFAFF